MKHALIIAMVALLCAPVHAQDLAHCRVTATTERGTPTRVECGGAAYVTLTTDEAKNAAAATLDVPRLRLALEEQTGLTADALATGRTCVRKLRDCSEAEDVWRERGASQDAAVLDLTAEVLRRHSTAEVVLWVALAGVGALLSGFASGWLVGAL